MESLKPSSSTEKYFWRVFNSMNWTFISWKSTKDNSPDYRNYGRTGRTGRGPTVPKTC